jgi:hypothetical protein
MFSFLHMDLCYERYAKTHLAHTTYSKMKVQEAIETKKTCCVAHTYEMG